MTQCPLVQPRSTDDCDGLIEVVAGRLANAKGYLLKQFGLQPRLNQCGILSLSRCLQDKVGTLNAAHVGHAD
jgi:hypothetical protein